MVYFINPLIISNLLDIVIVIGPMTWMKEKAQRDLYFSWGIPFSLGVQRGNQLSHFLLVKKSMLPPLHVFSMGSV